MKLDDANRVTVLGSPTDAERAELTSLNGTVKEALARAAAGSPF